VPRSTVAIIGSIVVFVGGIVTWYGLVGLHYAVTRAPAADRFGDLGSAGVAMLTGLILVFAAVRRARVGDRRQGRDDDSGE
jgi:hypothetical protein